MSEIEQATAAPGEKRAVWSPNDPVFVVMAVSVIGDFSQFTEKQLEDALVSGLDRLGADPINGKVVRTDDGWMMRGFPRG